MLIDGGNNEIDGRPKYYLQIGDNVFSGNTPSICLAKFCEYFYTNYPLTFRNILEKKKLNGNLLNKSKHGLLKPIEVHTMPYSLYIENVYSSDQVLEFCCSMLMQLKGNDCIPIMKDAYPIPSVETKDDQELTVTDEKTVELSPLDKRHISKVEDLAFNAGLDGITFDQLKIKLGWTMKEVRRSVKLSEILCEIDSKVISIHSLEDFEEGANALENIVKRLLKRNDGCFSSTLLYQYAIVDCEFFLNINGINNIKSLYDFSRFLFEKINYHGLSVYYNGYGLASSTDLKIENNLDLALAFASKQSGSFPEEMLEEYYEKVGLRENVRSSIKLFKQPYFFLIEPHVLISADQIKINDSFFEQINHAMRRLFDDLGDHVVLRDINSSFLSELPDLPGNMQWTVLLLQNIVFFYEDKLGGVHTISALKKRPSDNLHSMIVSKDSEIQNFGDVIICTLIENKVRERNFKASNLRRLLIQYNIIGKNELSQGLDDILTNDSRFVWDATFDSVRIVLD